MLVKRIWIDDTRQMPPYYDYLCKSVNETISLITNITTNSDFDIVLSLDHDAGEYVDDGGDYIKILDFLEELEYYGNNVKDRFAFSFHSANPVGVQNMKRICDVRGWRVI